MSKADAEEGLRVGLRTAMESLMKAARLEGWTLHTEDKARELAGTPGMQHVKWALERFEQAVNEFWLHAENTGVSSALAKKWCAENRKRADWLDFDTVSAEATFQMRGVLVNYAASEIKMPLALFAYRRVSDHLTRLLARESGVPLSTEGTKDAALTAGQRGCGERVDIGDTPEAQLIDNSQEVAR